MLGPGTCWTTPSLTPQPRPADALSGGVYAAGYCVQGPAASLGSGTAVPSLGQRSGFQGPALGGLPGKLVACCSARGSGSVVGKSLSRCSHGARAAADPVSALVGLAPGRVPPRGDSGQGAALSCTLSQWVFKDLFRGTRGLRGGASAWGPGCARGARAGGGGGEGGLVLGSAVEHLS